MADSTDPLVLDLVEWIAREPRLYSEVIETWRTSCPRLTIWEDAVDRGYVDARERRGSGSEGSDHRGRRQVSARAWPGQLTRPGQPIRSPELLPPRSSRQFSRPRSGRR